jgi:Family of unknown function (DUF6286)
MSASPTPTVHPGGCCEQRADTAPGVLPPPGRQPSAVPAAAPAGVFLALVLLGAGIVALRDTAVALQWLHGTPWIDAVIDRIDGMSFAWWVIPAGVAALAVGAVLVISAVRPSRKTALAVKATSSVWISPWALAGASTFAANSVPGVFDARTAATRRKLAVSARVADTTTVDAKTAEIDAAVRSAIQFLADPPKITVHITEGPTT